MQMNSIENDIPIEYEKKFLIKRNIVSELIFTLEEKRSKEIISDVYLSLDWQDVITRIRLVDEIDYNSNYISITSKGRPIDGYPPELELSYDGSSPEYDSYMKMALMYTSNGFPQVSKTRVTYYMDNFSIMVDDYYMDDYYIVEVEASEEKYLSQFDSVVKEEDRSSLFGKEWSNFNIAKDGLPIN